MIPLVADESPLTHSFPLHDELMLRGRMANGLALCDYEKRIDPGLQCAIYGAALAALGALVATCIVATSTLPVAVTILAGVGTLWLMSVSVTIATLRNFYYKRIQSWRPVLEAGAKGDYEKAHDKLKAMIPVSNFAYHHGLRTGFEHPLFLLIDIRPYLGKESTKTTNLGALLLYTAIHDLRNHKGYEKSLAYSFFVRSKITKEAVGEYAFTEFSKILSWKTPIGTMIEIATQFDETELDNLRQRITDESSSGSS